MSTLRLITSHSQHRLLTAVAETIRTNPLAPFEQEEIVILSTGMARWMSIELASQLGIAAGLHFSFPNDLIDRCFKALLPEMRPSLPFTHTALSWRIAAQLPNLADTPGFEQIARYLGNGQDDRRLIQLSRAVADCFDQYTIFRPELVLSWDNGVCDNWQAQLWQSISNDCHGDHRAKLLHALADHVQQNRPPQQALPRRISIFGISYLPPFHIEVLRLLSHYTSITCYLLNPCGEYWGSIISPQKQARLALSYTGVHDAQEYYETGNPLLSSLGTLGQEFFETLLDYGFAESNYDDDIQPPTPTTVLAAIQHDILTLHDRTATGQQGVMPPQDKSLQVHSCHSPLREMEILYDQLLALFDALSNLESRHVVVMIPDIESYAPFISSVFGSHSTGRPHLPYTIADRSVRTEHHYVAAFLKLITMVTGRFELSPVLELLETTAIKSRFNLDDDELLLVRQWLEGCQVRWGLDAEQRTALGFPEYADFSWQAGLDRLLLGYAMGPAGSTTFAGILPYAACSGSQASALGKLMDFLAALTSTVRHFERSRTVSAWCDLLTATCDLMLAADDSDTSGVLAVVKSINSLREAQTLHGFSRPLSLAAVQDHLTDALSQSGSGFGFMGGAITFCAMLPMRSIPMRVIWLAGLNDGIFPRSKRLPGFSLMNGARRRGDRSLRDEDRYLFLEALMAAQECFGISYVGQSNRDNSTIPPSVLVTELTDYVSKGFRTPENGNVSVLTSHRLQGFSPLYFDGSTPQRYFSYDQATCRALEARRNSGYRSHTFLPEALSVTGSSVDIDLPQLLRFLSNPAAAFLNNSLQVFPFTPGEGVAEAEPFALDSLDRYTLAQDVVTRMLAGQSYDGCLEAARCQGVLPPLTSGTAAFDNVWEKGRQFVARLTPHLTEPQETLPVSFSHGTIHLTALLTNCRSHAQLRWRCANMKGKDRLAIWLEHLLLNYAASAGYPRSSIMVAQDSFLELAPLANAGELLGQILELYAEGMTRPLRFFPDTSWAVANNIQNKAESAWAGDQWRGIRGEKDHQAVRICFGDTPPWGTELEQLAQRVYAPLLKASSSHT